MPQRIVAIVVGAIAGILVLEPALDRTQPYERFNGRIEPQNPHPNSEVKITYDVKTWKQCPGTVTRHVIDGNGKDNDYAPHEAYVFAQKKDEPVFVIKFVLPAANEKALEKDWVYYADAKYYCNWFQRYIWPLPNRTPPIYFRPTRD